MPASSREAQTLRPSWGFLMLYTYVRCLHAPLKRQSKYTSLMRSAIAAHSQPHFILLHAIRIYSAMFRHALSNSRVYSFPLWNVTSYSCICQAVPPYCRGGHSPAACGCRGRPPAATGPYARVRQCLSNSLNAVRSRDAKRQHVDETMCLAVAQGMARVRKTSWMRFTGDYRIALSGRH